MTQAQSYDELRPLITLCKAGRLFDVQNWIANGKPVNLPSTHPKGGRTKGPLEIAIESGFHSLVQVLLEGGAETEDHRYSALVHVLSKKRLDLMELLVEHGADIQSIDMASVFESWAPEIMEFFVKHGADVETGNPLAYALEQRILTALGVYKRHKDRFLNFPEQLNIALRHHCGEGNLKWVSILLYAGADPYSKGQENSYSEPDPESFTTALELAARRGNIDVFKMKKMHLDPKHPESPKILYWAFLPEKSDLLEFLLAKGFDPRDQEDDGSSMLESLLVRMDWQPRKVYSFELERGIDTSGSREKIKKIHLLARHGAKWVPAHRSQINDVRRSLLKLSSDYTVEFIWIMSGYNACQPEHLEQLMNPPSIRAHVDKHLSRIIELINTLKAQVLVPGENWIIP
jgi:hypothetical protein